LNSADSEREKERASGLSNGLCLVCLNCRQNRFCPCRHRMKNWGLNYTNTCCPLALIVPSSGKMEA